MRTSRGGNRQRENEIENVLKFTGKAAENLQSSSTLKSFDMNHSPHYHYKGLDADLDEYLSEYKTQTPLESDHYAGE
jgi:hypothetical protein